MSDTDCGVELACCVPESACGGTEITCCSNQSTATTRPVCHSATSTSFACLQNFEPCGNGQTPDAGPSASPDSGSPQIDGSSDAGTPRSDAASNLCTSTSGTLGTDSCCASVADFPNTCAIGACGCSAASSHAIQVCTCPAGSCFDPAMGCIGSDASGG
jgi:hypothetical protein